MDQRANLIEWAVDIVTAYVGANKVQPDEIPALVSTVFGALRDISTGGVVTVQEAAREPAVPIKRSVTPEFIVCLEDGKKFKSLKRHLRTRYGMTPEEYRAKWGLPHDYPMVAPNYAKARSDLAKRMGLGTSRRG